MKIKVLVVEDDLLLQETICEMLNNKGFEVDSTNSYDEAIELTYANSYQCYVFDINIEKGNGFELLKSLRDSGDMTPTLFLTSLTDTNSVVTGFDLGANDYLKKPFDFEELYARIYRFVKPDSRYEIANNIYYNPNLCAICRDKNVTYLKAKESEILEYFLKNPNRVISKDEIISYIWNDDYITDSTFRGYILKIKDAIGREYIKNIRGKGYIFEKL